MKKSSSLTVSPLDAHLGFWLRFVSNQVSARFEKQLEQHDITLSEWVALRTLYERAHTTHAELITALGMTKGAASKVVTKLQGKGLAERPLAEDRAREQRLLLTAAGHSLVPKLAALADENDLLFFGHLSDAQRAEMMSLMQDIVLRQNLTQVPIN
ncbi:MarR family winged helix-turn-helix transcriptional regulator [Pseudomonas sp. GLN_6]|uniref:MarR family winged helix-turn-helix transcriptional regulator n=1 Tax=Pseudomonas sp. GLN_6 TaxID=3367183 RepID=UPI00370A52E0